MSGRIAKKLLIVGWDAADWKIIDALLAKGGMKHLKGLIDRGARGDLTSLDPKLSPLLWTSIATGKTADKHGVLNFLEPDPAGAGLRISCSTTRRVKALWNILTQRGLTTNVVSWYASHPAEPIRGVVVSNLFQEHAPGAVHPADRTAEVAACRVQPGDVTDDMLARLLPDLKKMNRADPRVKMAAKVLAQCLCVDRVAMSLLAGAWDCTMVFHEAIDVAGHHFMQYYPPRMEHVNQRDFEQFRHVMPGVYELQDEMLGKMLAAAGPETTVILISDHGFHSDHLRPKVQTAIDDQHAAMDATWHRPLGVIAMAGPGIAHAPISGATLLDVAPTALTLLGLPVGGDMDGRVLIEALATPGEIERVPSWDDEPGEAGLHPPDLRLDPFEARSAMAQLADLGYVEASTGDDAADVAMCDRETRFNLGVVLMTTSRPKAAGEIFEKLFAEYPKDARFGMNWAHCLMACGEVTRAGEVLGGLALAMPNNPDARLMHSSALMLQGNIEDAARVLEAAAKAAPTRPDVLCALAGVCVHLKRLARAEELLKRATTLDPDDPAAHQQMALLELAREQYEPAAEHALRAVELRHNFPEAHYTLGAALAWLEMYDYAVQSFRLALSLRPGMLEALKFAGAVSRKKGDGVGADQFDSLAATLEATRATPPGPDLSAGTKLDPRVWAKHAGVL
ncbi:MAG: tetratricopeptide repeat protein [Tepidisphaera sp.]|nr:tetratricopeptide repeat protein [Tepidisphaera sp.]